MSTQTAKQGEPSFLLNFEPEDPSELSLEAASIASHSSPCKTSSVLGSLHDSHGTLGLDEAFERNTLAEPRAAEVVVAETGNKTKHTSKRRTKSSNRLENIQEVQRSPDGSMQKPQDETRKLSRKTSIGGSSECTEERGKRQSGKRTSKRASRHSSAVDASKQQGKRSMKGASRRSTISGADQKSNLRPVRSASFSGFSILRDKAEDSKPRTLSRKTSSSKKKEKSDYADLDLPSVSPSGTETAVVEDSKARRLQRKSSKRKCVTEQLFTESDVEAVNPSDPIPEEQQDLSKIGKVRDSLRRSLSDLGLRVGGIGDPTLEEDPSSKVGPQQDLSKIGKVRKSVRRSLSDLGLAVGGNADHGAPIPHEDPICSERQQQEVSKMGKVGKSLRRSLSDLRLPVGGSTPQQVSCKSPVAVNSSARKGSEQPKESNRHVLKRLGSVRRVIKGRLHVETRKSSISTRIRDAKLSPFENYLTCNLWSDNPSEVAMALGKLSSLCALERKESLRTLELVGGGAIVGALRKWYLDPDIQVQGLRLLSTIVVDISDRFVEGIMRCGGFEIIMSAMENHPSDQTLQEFACGSIFTIVNTKSSNNSEKFINDLDGLPVLLRPLLSFPTNAEIRKNVKLAFNSMKRFQNLHESLALGEPIVRRSKAISDPVSPKEDVVQEIPGAGNHPNNVCNISCIDIRDT